MFRGSMVAVVTPMMDNGDIDYSALQKLVEFHIDNGTDALVPAGTTGESATLIFDEHCEVVRRVVEMTNGRVPVIAGTGANSTHEALELTRDAQEVGADACLVVTPYYNKPTQEGLYQHYKTLAESVNIPQILYNVPGRTACDMLAETVHRLSQLKNIIGIKEASGLLERSYEIMKLCGGDFAVYGGEDPIAAEMMLNGGRGVISVTANIAPAKMHEMCEAALKGDRETALEIDRQLQGLHRELFVESNPIPAKWALYEMGMIAEGIRLPLTRFSEKYHDQLRQAMKQAGVY